MERNTMLFLFLSFIFICDLLHGVEFEPANFNFSYFETGQELKARTHNYFNNESFVELMTQHVTFRMNPRNVTLTTLGNGTTIYYNLSTVHIGNGTNNNDNTTSAHTVDLNITITSNHTETSSTYTPSRTDPTFEERFLSTSAVTGPYITPYPPGFGPELTTDTEATLNPSVAEYAKKWLEEMASSTATPKLLVPKLDQIVGYDYSADKFSLTIKQDQETPEPRLSERQIQNIAFRRQTRPMKHQRATEPQISNINLEVGAETQIPKKRKAESITETQVYKKKNSEAATVTQTPKETNLKGITTTQISKKINPESVTEPLISKKRYLEVVTEPHILKNTNQEDATESHISKKRNQEAVTTLQATKKRKGGAVTKTEVSKKTKQEGEMEPQTLKKTNPEPVTTPQTLRKTNEEVDIALQTPNMRKSEARAVTEPQISNKENSETDAETSWYDSPSELEDMFSEIESGELDFRTGNTSVTKKKIVPDLLLDKAIISDDSYTDYDNDDDEDTNEDDDDDTDDDDYEEDESKEITLGGDENKNILRMHVKSPMMKHAMRIKIPTTRMVYVRHTMFPSESTATTLQSYTYKKTEEIRQDRYLIVFLIELSRLIATKKKQHVHDVLKHVDEILRGFFKTGNLKWVPKRLKLFTKNGTRLITEKDTSVTQTEASKLHHVLRLRSKMLSDEVNRIIESADRLYDNHDGAILMEALNQFAEYPNCTLSGYWLCNSLLNSFLRPYRRLTDTRQQKLLMDDIDCALNKTFPEAFQKRQALTDQTKSTNATTKSPKDKKKKHHRLRKRKRKRKRHPMLPLKNWTLTFRKPHVHLKTEPTNSSTKSPKNRTRIHHRHRSHKKKRKRKRKRIRVLTLKNRTLALINMTSTTSTLKLSNMTSTTSVQSSVLVTTF